MQIIDPRIRSGHTRLIPSTQLPSRPACDWSVSTNERPDVERRQTDSAGRGWTALFTSDRDPESGISSEGRTKFSKKSHFIFDELSKLKNEKPFDLMTILMGKSKNDKMHPA